MKTQTLPSPGDCGRIHHKYFTGKNIEINLLSKYVGKQYLDNTQSDNKKLDPFYT